MLTLRTVLFVEGTDYEGRKYRVYRSGVTPPYLAKGRTDLQQTARQLRRPKRSELAGVRATNEKRSGA